MLSVKSVGEKENSCSSQAPGVAKIRLIRVIRVRKIICVLRVIYGRVSTEAFNKIGIIVSLLLIIFFSSAECIRNTNGLIVFISTTEHTERTEVHLSVLGAFDHESFLRR